MKVCLVLAGNEDGGLEKHTIELSKDLKKQNVDVFVIAHQDFAPFFKDVHFLPLDLTKGRNNPYILFKLQKIIKQHGFDIVHTQANKATDMVIKIKPLIKSKIVSTLHSYKKDTKSFEKSDHVITVSNSIGKKIKNQNKTCIYNGINYTKVESVDYLYDKYSIPKGPFILCSVGRLCDVKSFDVLISSLKDLDVFCILVGEGANEDQLRTLAATEGVNKKIVFTGLVDNSEVKDIISLSKLSVITSKKEGFSYFFAESLFYKTPLLSTDVADIKHILGEDYILPFNSPDAFNHKIKYIKENYEQVLSSFKHAFEFAQVHFTVDNMVDETIKVYQEVLA